MSEIETKAAKQAAPSQKAAKVAVKDASTRPANLKRKAWEIMLIVFLGGIALAWAQNKAVPVLADLQDFFTIDLVTASWISSIFSVCGIVLALPAAGMMRKMGLKVSGIVAIGVTIIGTVLGLFAGNAAILMASRVVEGLGLGLISVIAPAVISMWFAPEERGLPMGIWGAWQMVAQAGTFLFAASIIGAFGDWHGLWWVGLILLILGIVLYVAQVKAPPAEYNYADSEDTSVSMMSVFKYKSVWMILLVAFFFCMACFGWCTLQPTYWSEVAGLDLDTANAIEGWIYVAEMFIVIGEGALLNKIKNRKKFGIVMAVIYGVLLIFAFNNTSFVGILIFSICYPFLEGATCTVFWTITPQTTPKPQLSAAALAVLVMGMDAGMMLGPPVTSAIIESFGWGAASIEIAICGLLIAVFFALTQLYDENGKKIKG